MIKFGVYFKGTSQLVSVEAVAHFNEIFNVITDKFDTFCKEDKNKYGLLFINENEKAVEYISEENKGIITNGSIIHLVLIPSIDTKQIIRQLECELGSWNRKFNQNSSVLMDLLNLSKLLPCRQFASEFIKEQGHNAIFQMVEYFERFTGPDPVDYNCTLRRIWVSLMSTLAELAQYCIVSSDLHRDSTYAGSCESPELASTKSCVDSQEKITDRCHDICLNELFSWHLVSDTFLNTLIRLCWIETDLKALRDELKILLNIILNCPAHAPFIMDRTGTEFIYMHLKRANQQSTSNSETFSNQTMISSSPSTRRSSSQTNGTLHSSSFSSHNTLEQLSGTCAKPLRDNMNSPLQDELCSLLLELMYTFLYHANSRGELSNDIWQYLDYSHLKQLVDYIPQLKKDVPLLFKQSGIFLNGQRRSECTLKYIASVENCRTSDFVSDRDTLTPSQLSEVDTVLSKQQPGEMSNAETLTRSSDANSLGQNEVRIYRALFRLQCAQMAALAEEMHRCLNRNSPDSRVHVDSLCQFAYPDVSGPLSNKQRELAFKILGFKFPENPAADFETSPGHLGYKLLKKFLETSDNLLKEMLSYGRATALHRTGSFLSNSQPLSPPVPPSVGRMMGVRPSRSMTTSTDHYLPLEREQTELLPVPVEIQTVGRRKTTNGALPSNVPLGFLTDRKASFGTCSVDSLETHNLVPLFPIVEAANAVTHMLADVFHLTDPLIPSVWKELTSCDHFNEPFYPMLFNPRDKSISVFEDLFICVFSVLFYSWNQMNANPDDLDRVLCVLREQLLHTLAQQPVSIEQFEQILTDHKAQTLMNSRTEQKQLERTQMQLSHPVIKTLQNELWIVHANNVSEQRFTMMSRFAPLEYRPPKGAKQQLSKDESFWHVFLSQDRQSLTVQDQKKTTRDIWPLVCITGVSTGIEEKLKRSFKRTIVLQVATHDVADPNEEVPTGLPIKARLINPSLDARSIADFNCWLDGLSALLRLNRPSSMFAEDIQRLVELDMQIRLACLDLSRLPAQPLTVPPDPPNYDFNAA